MIGKRVYLTEGYSLSLIIFVILLPIAYKYYTILKVFKYQLLDHSKLTLTPIYTQIITTLKLIEELIKL